MGKGIAALTLDADYQRKRREQFAKRPENLGIGLVQGGKGLIVVSLSLDEFLDFISVLY